MQKLKQTTPYRYEKCVKSNNIISVRIIVTKRSLYVFYSLNLYFYELVLHLNSQYLLQHANINRDPSDTFYNPTVYSKCFDRGTIYIGMPCCNELWSKCKNWTRKIRNFTSRNTFSPPPPRPPHSHLIVILFIKIE